MLQPIRRTLGNAALLLMIALAGACAPSTREQALQATVDALAVRNAELETAQAAATPKTPAPALPTAAPLATQATPAFAGVAPRAPVETPAPGSAITPIPREVARIALVADGVRLADFRLDSAAQIAYLTDSEYNLHVVDLTSGQVVDSVPTSGDRLLLDASGNRLYIMPDAPWAREGISPTVTVFDTSSRTIVGALPGSRASVDGFARLYVGDVVNVSGREATGVRLYDAATLDLQRTGPMAGNPLYVPDADGLIIQHSSAWTADAETLEPFTDLYPQITGIDLPGCTGCPAAVDAFYFADMETVAIQTVILSPQGAGALTPADLYNADTMARFDGGYTLYATCSSQPQLIAPVNGRTLRTERFSRYVTYNNLYIQDEEGDKSPMRDGLWASFVNPSAGVAYLQPGSTSGYVLDINTLAPVGMIDSLCFFAQDGAGGLLYATDAQRHDLVVLEPTGGESKLPAAQHDTVAGKQVTAIAPSPNFAKDGTLFLVAWALDENGGQVILRSTDGGQTFTRLGGLPSGEDLALTLAVSPNFAQDRTLFAGGLRRESMGEGVWKSTDGGDTWAPVWNGLEHLRVDRIAISPRYGDDQTLLAWAPYAQITPMETGYSMQRSTDSGLTWTIVMTSAVQETLPAASVYLPPPPGKELPVRKRSWLEPIQFRIDNSNWTTATTALGDLGADEILRAILRAPLDAETPAIIVATDAGVYRTRDDGKTWTRLAESETGGAVLMAAAITPLLSDGSYRLLLATAEGEFMQLDPNTVVWEEMRPAAPAGASDVNSAATAIPLADATTAQAAPDREEQPATPSTAPAAPQATVAPLPVEPPAGFFRPTGFFGPAWEADGALQQALGFARSAQPNAVPAAYQYFEHGTMVWRGDTQQIYAIYDDGGWDLFDDTFKEGEAESDATLKAPGGLMQPVRGFGKVWRNDAGVQARLGWAVGKESGLNALIQDFERGVYLRADAVEAALWLSPTGREWQN